MPSFLRRQWPVGLFLLLTVLLTWPHARDLDFALPGNPQGAVHADPLLNVWTLQQGVRNVSEPGRGLFDSNAFWPRKNTLAYSDHLIGWLPFALPLSLLTHNWVLIFNILFLLTFFLCGLGAYLLVKDITRHQVAGVVGGIIFAFCSFRMTQYGHFAGESFPWLPFALWCVHRHLERKKWGYAFGALFFTFLQTLCSGIYGLFFCTFLGLFLAGRAALRKQFPLKGALQLAGFAAALFLLLLPFYWPNIQTRKELGFRHGEEENVRLSADVLTVLGSAEHSIDQFLIPLKLPPGEGIFPGFLALLLAAVGIRCGWKNGTEEKERAILYSAGALLAWLFCLGPVVKFHARPLFPGPYALLAMLPVFDVLRMTHRFAAIMMLCLAVLAGLGAREWLHHRKNRKATWAALLIGLAIVESASLPASLGVAPDALGLPKVYETLKRRPGNGAVVEIPYTHGYHDAYWMYFSMFHGKPILNGYSSYTPPEGKIAVMALVDFPAPEAVRFLDRSGATYVVVHSRILGREVPKAIGGLHLLQESEGDFLFEILKEGKEYEHPAPLSSRYVPASLTGSTEPSRAAKLLQGTGQPWPSSGFADTRTELVATFDGKKEVSAIELEFAPHADLFPARFEVVAETVGGDLKVLDGQPGLTDFYLSARARPLAPTLRIVLPKGPYLKLIIRPKLPAGMRAWPLRKVRFNAD